MALHTSTLVAVDFGKKRDFTAAVIVERVEDAEVPCVGKIWPPMRTPPPASYTCHHLQRFALNTS